MDEPELPYWLHATDDTLPPESTTYAPATTTHARPYARASLGRLLLFCAAMTVVGMVGFATTIGVGVLCLLLYVLVLSAVVLTRAVVR